MARQRKNHPPTAAPRSPKLFNFGFRVEYSPRLLLAIKQEMLPGASVFQLIWNQMWHPKAVCRCPGRKRDYFVILLGTVFSFRPRFCSTMSHSFLAAGDGGGEPKVFGAVVLRAVASSGALRLGTSGLGG